MADPSVMKARLARLQAELGPDLAVIARLGTEIVASSPPPADEAQLALAAVRLHRYYTAIETALERIERLFAALPAGPEWHSELLDGAALELPGVRPAILLPSTVAELRELLKFRHFFRHAYAVELDRGKLAQLAGNVARARGQVDASLGASASLIAELGRRLG